MRSPLPPREGISATRLRAPGGKQTSAKAHLPVPETIEAWLAQEFPGHSPEDRTWLTEHPDGGCLTDETGRPAGPGDPVIPGGFYFFHRPVPHEDPVPFDLTVLYEDRDIVVVDKPHFLASTPNGRFVRQSAVTRLRIELDEPDLVAVHRLDRVTAGLLLFSRRPETRGAYQVLFQNRRVHKTYRALAWLPDDFDADTLPAVRRTRLHKTKGDRQVVEIPGAPNTETRLRFEGVRGRAARRLPPESAPVVGPEASLPNHEAELTSIGEFALEPVTGKTHQLRVHLNGLGVPMVGDPVYPADCAPDPYDFSDPLQLVADGLSFTDPLSGKEREFQSSFPLSVPTGLAR